MGGGGRGSSSGSSSVVRSTAVVESSLEFVLVVRGTSHGGGGKFVSGEIGASLTLNFQKCPRVADNFLIVFDNFLVAGGDRVSREEEENECS